MDKNQGQIKDLELKNRKKILYLQIKMEIITVAFLLETMSARSEQSEILKVLREENSHQPRNLCPVRLSFKSEGAPTYKN